MFPQNSEEIYIDSLIRDHNAGLHDEYGAEYADCPACEDRAQDEAAAQAEQDAEQAK